MDFKKFLPWSFIISFVLTILGALFKIMHLPFALGLLTIGLLLLGFFIVVSVNEILKSKKLDGTEKFMWIMGLLFFGIFTGLLYLSGSRKKII
jgi:hypothetical protein